MLPGSFHDPSLNDYIKRRKTKQDLHRVCWGDVFASRRTPIPSKRTHCLDVVREERRMIMRSIRHTLIQAQHIASTQFLTRVSSREEQHRTIVYMNDDSVHIYCFKVHLHEQVNLYISTAGRDERRTTQNYSVGSKRLHQRGSGHSGCGCFRYAGEYGIWWRNGYTQVLSNIYIHIYIYMCVCVYVYIYITDKLRYSRTDSNTPSLAGLCVYAGDYSMWRHQ